ncbi:MAG: methylated-DNA--[protein]-cysteine S-methyltransferase [Ignavibacteriales bacterium]
MKTRTVYYKRMNFDLCDIIIAKTCLGNLNICFDNYESKFLEWIDKNFYGYKIVEVKNQFEPDVEKQISEYFSGVRTNFDLKVDAKLTDFQKRVFIILSKVPYGSVISYGEIAKKLGGVKYSRAVGNALNKNPLPIIIPCHRVIDSKGGIGGFSAGVDIKKKLLNFEKEVTKVKELSI